MQDREKLQEIEKIGEDEGLEEPEQEERRSGGYGTVPLVQTILCALALAALVFLKMTAPEKYEETARWYQGEAAQEIELPRWDVGTPSPAPSPSPSPAPSPASAPPAVDLDGASLQRV